MSKEKQTKLTERQKKFCREYLIDFNGTQACIRAGYSRKCARTQGAENLARPSIKAYLNKLQEKRNKKIDITAESVLRDLHYAQQVALGKEDSHIVVKNSIGGGMTETVSVPLKKTDINAFIKINELYMRHLGMFKDKIEVESQEKEIIVNILEDKK